MIQPLRQTHLRIFLVLAVLVPLIFVLALVKRRPLPPPVTPVHATATEVSR
jgi:hypothetical protein